MYFADNENEDDVTHEQTVLVVPYYNHAHGVYVSIEGESYPYGKYDQNDGMMRAPESDYQLSLSPADFNDYVEGLVALRDELKKAGRL